MRCQECDTTRHKKLYEDPRDPPLEEGPALCRECAHTALVYIIEELEDRIKDYRQQIKAL